MLTKTHRFRLIFPILASLAAYLAIGWRLYDLQVRQHESYATRADHQQHKKVLLTPRRGDIVDRNGATLATSYFSDTIIVDTRMIKDPTPELLDDLALVIRRAPIPIDAETSEGQALAPTRMSEARAREAVAKMFAKPRRHTLYRKAPEEVSQMMAFLEDQHKLPPGCVIYEKHSKRFYPNHVLASHILGFTEIDGSGDNIGISGIEKRYDKDLRGSYRQAQMRINSAQHGLAPLDEEEVSATYGNTVVLTLDKTIQLFAERALRAQVGRYQALGGIVIVMDVHTGELLAMASCPDFDPNEFVRADPLQLRNRVLTDPIEIGSVMKIITATLLIDHGLLTTDEMIDCGGGSMVFGTRLVKDTHSLGVVPFRTAFAESSNVGLVTVGLRLEPTVYYDGLTRFGLGRKVGIDLNGEGDGILHPLSEWSALSRSSLPMGYETALTPVQVISALSAIANDGVRVRPHLLREVRTPRGDTLRRVEPQQIERVASPETCATIRELMEAVVLEGTGEKAAVPGYRIGGKTGTSVKYTANRDPERRSYYASFAGLFPIDNPRLAVYCYVDEPRGAKYGGTVAAPIFREVVLAAAHILGIPPNDPAAFEAARAKGIHPMDAPLTSGTLLQDYLTSITAPGPTGAAVNVAALHGADAAEDAGAEPTTGTTAEDGALLPLGGDEGTTASTPLGPDELLLPDLRGLTMREVYDRAAELGLEVRALGTGLAQRQQPAPGARTRQGARVTVTFALPSQLTPGHALPRLPEETSEPAEVAAPVGNTESNGTVTAAEVNDGDGAAGAVDDDAKSPLPSPAAPPHDAPAVRAVLPEPTATTARARQVARPAAEARGKRAEDAAENAESSEATEDSAAPAEADADPAPESSAPVEDAPATAATPRNRPRRGAPLDPRDELRSLPRSPRVE